MKSYAALYERLMNYADSMKIIDTHEHLQPHKNFLGDAPDVLCDYLSHYISTDLQSAGMRGDELEAVRDHRACINERYSALEPWLDAVRNTSYFRALDISARKLHGVNGITRETIEELNERFKASAIQPGYPRRIMQDVCNIEKTINDYWTWDMPMACTELFAPTWQSNAYMTYTDDHIPPHEPTDDPIPRGEHEPETRSLEEYCEQYRRRFAKQKAEGMVTLKSPVAYWRPLYFEDVSRDEAEKLYNEAIKSKSNFPRKLQDYMMHFILQVANEEEFVIQIHTGIQEGMRHNLEDSNPMLLKNLFGKYPDLTFDLFHTGYPFERELAVLAKTHPNVYVDFCWSHLISPFGARNAFYEMLDVIPYTKIFGFGGDYLFFDGVIGHLTMAKQNLCMVLAQRIAHGECDVELAERILQAVLYDNAKRVFKV